MQPTLSQEAASQFNVYFWCKCFPIPCPLQEYEALKRAIKRLERVLDRLYKKNEILLRRKQLMELEGNFENPDFANPGYVALQILLGYKSHPP